MNVVPTSSIATLLSPLSMVISLERVPISLGRNFSMLSIQLILRSVNISEIAFSEEVQVLFCLFPGCHIFVVVIEGVERIVIEGVGYCQNKSSFS